MAAPPKLKFRTFYTAIRYATSPAQCAALCYYLLTAACCRGP